MRITFIVLIAVAAGVLAGCGKKEGEVKAVVAAPVRVAVERVEARPFAATVAVTGSLVSRSHVDVKAETTGRLVRFPKEEGAAVAAGEALAWVDEENYRLSLRQAESAVGVAEAALARIRVSESHSRSELERARNLVKSGGITDKDLKAAELAEQDSRAQAQLAAAQLDEAKAVRAAAEKRLRDAIIHAPVAGEIAKKHVNPGAYVEPATAIVTLVDNGRLELESLVASSEIGAIRPGQRVRFTVNSFPGQEFEGSVVELNPSVDSDTRSAKARIQVNNAGRKLKAGMFAQGEIQTGVASQAILIPTAALYRDDRSAKSAYVFVVENGKAVRRNVRLGSERDVSVEIVNGLKPGDVLVAEQSVEIGEGVRVEPLAPRAER